MDIKEIVNESETLVRKALGELGGRMTIEDIANKVATRRFSLEINGFKYDDEELKLYTYWIFAELIKAAVEDMVGEDLAASWLQNL